NHELFAGFLPPMREKIVDLLAAHDVIAALGASAFTYHVEGTGPHLPAGARLVQLIDDPNIAAWAPQGTSAVGSIRLGVLDLLARETPRPRARPAPRRAPPRARHRAAHRRASGPRRRCPSPSSCKRFPSSAILRRSSSRKRQARARRCRPICRSCLAKRSTPCAAAASGTACRRPWALRSESRARKSSG